MGRHVPRLLVFLLLTRARIWEMKLCRYRANKLASLFSGPSFCLLALPRAVLPRFVAVVPGGSLCGLASSAQCMGSGCLPRCLPPLACWSDRFRPSAPQIVWIITYVILIPALLFWAELSLGTLRRFFQLMVFPASAIAVAGIFAILSHQSPQRFMPYSNVLAICSLLASCVANVVPRIGRRHLMIQSRVSAIGTLILAAAVIHENLRGTFLNLRELSLS